MKNLLAGLAAAACGVATSVLAALINVGIAYLFDFNLFKLSFWVIVPVGAILLGLVAASGYHFGSIRFNRKPGKVLLVQMLVIAGLAMLLIYWLGYRMMRFGDGGYVADILPFGQFLHISLTKASYAVGRSSAQEAGGFGYFLAAIQFGGFLIGAGVVYIMLASKAMCASCELYLDELASKRKGYADASAASAYFDTLFTLPADGHAFAEMIRAEASVQKAEHGALRIDAHLLACPRCQVQTIDERVQGHNGKGWKLLQELDRRLVLPKGLNLMVAFGGGAAAR
ncbi:hypothetical protein [Massilia glaciei]|uniref:Zinc-finger domain-containing protein n=1 Tax=Massilia glaciei TaxID=1524097 RepID=A0A2U2I797_9BURK|nr:hypothetical protein [Massilia glaciei]PWF55529.1 hypothetical protein C7C56_000990 [Massilia glaciei]